jgi:signal transduction histidine kinase
MTLRESLQVPNKISHLWPSLSDSPSTPVPPRARILLVDDVHANLVALEAVLEPLGQELVRAGSGDEALKALLLGDFACILMDVQMPGLDGLETAALVRSRERTRHIPILFITALSREAAYVTRGYEHGAVDYLLKPVDPAILRAKVQVFVELYLRGEEMKRQALEIAAHRRAEEELQRAAEFEQHLVGIVGHDIRTPLSVILVTAQAHLASNQLEPAQRTGFERVARSGERIHQISELLLDFTRARLGGGIPVVLQAQDLNKICQVVADEFHAAHPDRVLECNFSGSPLLGEWDAGRMAQVVANLLDNALKYSPAGTAVRITTRQHGTDSAAIEVHNEGTPIPEELVPKLFKPFQRLAGPDQSSRTSLGLGLYIVHSIVQAHKGSITVDSTDTRGTIFRVCLPLHRPGAAVPDPSEQDLPSPREQSA